MANLVAFGCSLTFGHGLPDCFIPPVFPGKGPSNLAWPSLVASKLGMGCVNKSAPGASNFEIALSIVSYDFSKGDRCFIMWSYPERDLMIDDSGLYERIGAWADPTKFKAWLGLNPAATISAKFWFNVLSANNHLGMKNMEPVNLTVGLEYIPGVVPQWASKIRFLSANINRYRQQFPKALDNRHPGELAHQAFANEVLAEIGNGLPCDRL